MKKELNLKSNFSIEKLTENELGVLVCGFSNISITTEGILNPQANETNNCNGGNCAAGCGSGQTINKIVCAKL